MGWWTVTGQVLFVTVAMPVLRLRGRGRKRDILSAWGMDDVLRRPAHMVTSVNAAETIALLEELKPVVIVVNGTRIIAPKVLECVDCPIINVHAGITPQYRGVHGGYWALAEGHPELVGTTVHLVDPGIDTGTVLVRAYFDPSHGDSIATYPYLHLAVGLPALTEQVDRVLRGQTLESVADQDPGTKSHLHSHPTLWGYLWRLLTRGVG
jgi:methionyl-tRNA formyltransferase